MAPLGASALYLTGTAAAILVWVFFKRSRQHGLPYPPGPKPLPIIGNLLDFPTEKEWLVFHQWNEEYGDVVYTEALGQRTIFLGSTESVNDLLERRGTIYSDRPHMVMTNELMDCQWILTFIPYGERWRKQRKLMHSYMHAGAAPTFHPVQIHAAQRLVVDLLVAPQQPNTLPSVVQCNVGQAIIKMVYGIDVRDADSEFTSIPGQLARLLTESVMPGRFLIDLIPSLRHIPAWMPGAGFHTFGQNAAVLSRTMRDKPVVVVKADMANGTAPSSMIRSMLEKKQSRQASASLSEDDVEDDVIKDVSAMAYIAGSDTTVSATMSFFLAMLIYPEVQQKAQAEIDRVVGCDRLPEMEDMIALPYVSAVVTETLRWLPVLPMGAPHMTSADDEYKGYFIPKGTAIFGSAWAILHNPRDYPDPEVFIPERYVTMTPEGAYEPKPNAPDPRLAAFGFGRRICVGRHIADASLFASVATVLATVNVVRAKDREGNETVPEVVPSSGFLSHPKPFEYVLEYRDESSWGLLATALEHAEC